MNTDIHQKNASAQLKIQQVTQDSIDILLNGELLRIQKKLDTLVSLLEQNAAQTIQTADKIYNIGSITQANFDFVLGQSQFNGELSKPLAKNLIIKNTRWFESLKRALLQEKVAVGARPLDIIQHYGWLIEEFLRKMLTETGQKTDLRAFSYMTEAWQSSLRYLCYIQLAQILQAPKRKPFPELNNFLNLDPESTQEAQFDYLNLLILATDYLRTESSFMPEITALVQELSNPETQLFEVAQFLDRHRGALLRGSLKEDEALEQTSNEYLTALLAWLKRLSFLANYRLVSIKDINLNYRIGTPKNFVHLYGELHGMYNQLMSFGGYDEDYDTKIVEGVFTYNQSVLLFKGANIRDSLDRIKDENTYLSISPLLIDQSVFANKATQTPEIYYYAGGKVGQESYKFALYKNELPVQQAKEPESNKYLDVLSENLHNPNLNELYDQVERIFRPFKIEEV